MTGFYRKKPVVIEARQFTKHNCDELADWIANSGWGVTAGWTPSVGAGDYLYIETLEGTMRAEVGDWIIKGVQGEFYPCKPDVFEQTYEPVEDRLTLDDLLHEAWGVIANAGWGGGDKSEGWQEAAERWRDRYHKFITGEQPAVTSIWKEKE